MKKILFVVCILIAMLTIDVMAYADEIVLPNDGIYTGLEIMSEEEMEAFHDTIPKIVDVKPNSIALSRLSEEESILFENIEIAEVGEEMVYSMPGEEAVLLSETEFQLPDAVDVSQSLTFPPVGNQGQTGSCLPWAFCYYQLTNNRNVVNGLHAKTEGGEAIPDNIMAPGFIYTLLNGGKNTGTNFEFATEAVMSFGCPNISHYDLEITNENLGAWCTDTDTWYNAIYNRPAKITYDNISSQGIVNTQSDCVKKIKQILSNGYVVSFSTYIRSWVFTDQTSTGTYAIRYMKSDELGPHAMSVVGYDDNFWIDVNGNNREETNEHGAFKIVNSWGSENTFFPQGFIWIAYDALGDVSGVTNAPVNRAGIMKEHYYFIEPQKEYTPLLIAELELRAMNRDNVAVEFMISDIDNNLSAHNPVSYSGRNMPFYGACNFFPSDNVNFSGIKDEQETVRIPFDLTPIVKKIYKNTEVLPKNDLEVYVYVYDESYGEVPIILGEVKLVEPISGKEIMCTDAEDMIVGEDRATKRVNFKLTPIISFDNKKSIVVVFNSDINEATVKDNVVLMTPNGETVLPKYEVEGKRLLVLPPDGGYGYDSKYEIQINKNVKSIGGNGLDFNNKISIYIHSEYFILEEIEE